MWEYTDKVKDLYTDPVNVGKMEDADGVGHVGSVVCGDALTLYIKVRDGVIVDSTFETFGCGSAIASSSALTEMVKGKTIEEAEKITNQDIVEYLGGLPEQKIHCSVMGSEALENAIANYRGEEPAVEDEPEGEMICHCKSITDVDLKKAIKDKGIVNIEDLIAETGAGSVCGSCIPRMEDILDEEKWKPQEPAEEFERGMTNIQKIRKIEDLINSKIRPALKRDGGDVELVDVVDDLVVVKLHGACSTCVSANDTLQHFVQEELRAAVSDKIIVKHI